MITAPDWIRLIALLDSPLAHRATDVFRRHARELELDGDAATAFAGPNLHIVETVEQSKDLARVTSGAILIAGSGMCDAGRIKHHLKEHLWRPRSTVLFVGYQAPGTLGRLLPGLSLESLPAGLAVDEAGFVVITSA